MKTSVCFKQMLGCMDSVGCSLGTFKCFKSEAYIIIIPLFKKHLEFFLGNNFRIGL